MSETVHFASIEKARAIVQQHAKRSSTERVTLANALNRVLAEPIQCDMDYPPFKKAMMDGYAVRAADLHSSGHGTLGDAVSLSIVDQIAAGHEPAGSVAQGQAMQINTGAPMPPGADTVVRVEDAERSADGFTVSIKVPVPAGKHVDARGKYVTAGATVLEPGERMRPGHVAVAAAAGAGELTVYRRLRVAILVTGDELVDVSQRPSGARIRNSNGPMLDALVRTCHAQAVNLGVVGDDREALTANIKEGLQANILCLSGGISMGAFDYVPEVLEACGVRILVHKIAIKPGKPTLFGVADSGTCVFALPGNPIGCFVAFWLLVPGAIERSEGCQMRPLSMLQACLKGHCQATADRQEYLPAHITIHADGRLLAQRLSWRGSADPFGFCRANGWIVRAPGAPEIADGGVVSILPLERL